MAKISKFLGDFEWFLLRFFHLLEESKNYGLNLTGRLCISYFMSESRKTQKWKELVCFLLLSATFDTTVTQIMTLLVRT